MASRHWHVIESSYHLGRTLVLDALDASIQIVPPGLKTLTALPASSKGRSTTTT